jgi:quinol monooxygenase YgiN
MIIIAGTLNFVDQENRDGAIAAIRDLQQSTRDTEPGCVSYSFAADSGDATRVQVYEHWVDEESLAAHFRHANYLDTRAMLGQFKRAGGSQILKFRADLSEPVYDSNGVPRADFFTVEAS